MAPFSTQVLWLSSKQAGWVLKEGGSLWTGSMLGFWLVQWHRAPSYTFRQKAESFHPPSATLPFRSEMIISLLRLEAWKRTAAGN